MRVHEIEVRPSPRTPDWMRLRASVAYDSGSPSAEEYWLDVPPERATSLHVGGDPWLVWLAPLAITIREPLRVEAPVDERLLANVRQVLRIWSSWYPRLHASDVDAPVADPIASAAGTASFFSGGVDSFFTALRHIPNNDSAIDALIFVWGFDIALGDERGWRGALASNARAARALETPLLCAATNLRETRFREADWTWLSHGPALGGVAQALAGAFGTAMIPSSAGYRNLRPWGSHPLTDPLFGSSHTRIVHEGAEYHRGEKTEYVARSELALRHLRVCYESADGGNCGACKRCYRTMLALAALGALDRCATFKPGALDLRRASRIFCEDETDTRQFGYVKAMAEREGRLDIAHAVDRSLARSERVSPWVDHIRSMGDRRLVWRWTPAWERFLLRGWIV